ncbi:hypothetical protein ACHAXN_012329 [Cyclotella atomus]|jgi:alkylated DNA repair dioxygenase AlkB
MMPDGFHIEHNAVNAETWEKIRHWLSTGVLPPSRSSSSSSELVSVPIPWESGPQMQNRRIAQFGDCKYDYIKDVATACDDAVAPIPQYICETLLTQDERPQYTQCIINCYNAKNEIPWHLDHEYFGPEVLVYTFGEARPLLFRRRRCQTSSLEESNTRAEISLKKDTETDQQNDKCVTSYEYATAQPNHCSKYILKGSARSEWEHSVPTGNAERVSITFRSWHGPRKEGN